MHVITVNHVPEEKQKREDAEKTAYGMPEQQAEKPPEGKIEQPSHWDLEDNVGEQVLDDPIVPPVLNQILFVSVFRMIRNSFVEPNHKSHTVLI